MANPSIRTTGPFAALNQPNDIFDPGEVTADPAVVCGIDEAGRGPLAGPVTAGAVILGPDFPCAVLNDSKRLSPAARFKAAAVIRKHALSYALGWAWPEEIDRYNIHCASLLAMERALRALGVKPELVLVDGKFTPRSPVPCRAVVKGDASIPVIMAASIIAKTGRDVWMERYARLEPGYGFEVHKGYPTAGHRKAVARLGLSPIHRRSFRIALS
jgi:ribonuclease HII